MSSPLPNVRPTTSTQKIAHVSNVALSPILALNELRLGWAIRNPIGSGSILFICLSNIGVPATDLNAGYALQPGDILTDNACRGYAGLIFGTGDTLGISAVVTELF